MDNPAINEASGLAVSRRNNGILWAHNDSGNQPFLFAINGEGKSQGVFELKGIKNRDWEDIAVGPGPVEGVNYVYIGEIGDNDASHDTKYIYRFPEPAVAETGNREPLLIENIDVISFQYPDGTRDAETLMIDPKTKDLYIISKRERNVHLYRMPYPQPAEVAATLEEPFTLPFSSVVAGDISDEGDEILLKTYTEVYHWRIEKDESIIDALRRNPSRLPYTPEPQGEAIAWQQDGSGYFTLSEENAGILPVLYYYERKP